MDRRVLWAAFLCFGLGAACSLGRIGLEPLDGGVDATAPNLDAGRAEDADGGGPADARALPVADAVADGYADAGVDGTDACGSTSEGPEKANAFPSNKAKVLDGILDDWGCETPLAVTSANAEAKYNADGGAVAVSMRVLMEWDPTALYVAFDVTAPQPQGTDTVDPSNNDSAELYLGGGLFPTANYGSSDHHYIFDYKDLASESPPQGPGTSPPPNVTWVTKKTGGVGYVTEARVAAAAVGLLFAGRSLGLDLQVNGGIKQATYLLWAMTNHGGCGQCTPGACCCVSPPDAVDRPYCDGLRFGTLTLK